MRMLPGVYSDPLVFDQATITTLEVIATGATILGFTAIELRTGADVKLRGPELVGRNFAVSCGQTDEPSSRLQLSDATLSAAAEDSSALITGANCSFDVSRTVLRRGGDGAVILIASDAAFRGDRLHVISPGLAGIGLLFRHVSLVITNSILENPQFLFATNDSTAPDSSVRLAFNTMVFTSPGNGILCQPNSGSAHRSVVFENNILFAASATSVVEGDDCTFTNNVIFPQEVPIANNTIADPMFVDVATGDFRVLPTSPAVGAADPTLSISTDHDFQNTPRPQGPAPDIGAFEQ
ncbi:MAG: hypothetical protein H0V17_34560 [Deltaproteobacteria bacterium]|nr:hypothetical protein [Deltaproteobacteria bacterium]